MTSAQPPETSPEATDSPAQTLDSGIRGNDMSSSLGEVLRSWKARIQS